LNIASRDTGDVLRDALAAKGPRDHV